MSQQPESRLGPADIADLAEKIRELIKPDNEGISALQRLGEQVQFTPRQRELFQEAANPTLRSIFEDGVLGFDQVARHMMTDPLGKFLVMGDFFPNGFSPEFYDACLDTVAVTRSSIEGLRTIFALSADGDAYGDHDKTVVHAYFDELEAGVLENIVSFAAAAKGLSLQTAQDLVGQTKENLREYPVEGVEYLARIDPEEWPADRVAEVA